MRRYSLAAAILATLLAPGLSGCGGSKQEGVARPSAGPMASPGKSLDLSYVGSDFCAAVVVHPLRIAQSPLVGPLLKEEFLAQRIMEFGIDPTEVEEIIVLAPVPPKHYAPPGTRMTPTTIVRLAKAEDVKTMLANLSKSLVTPGTNEKAIETRVEGKTCYQYPRSPGSLACVADEKTVLFGSEADVRKALSAGEATGPLAERLRQADAHSDLIVAAALDPIRETVKDAAAQAKENAPPPLAPFIDIPSLIQGATLTVSLSGDPMLRLSMDAHDAASADRVEALGKQGLQMANEQMAAIEKSLPGEAKKTFASALTVADQGLGGLTVTKTDRQVVLAVKRPASMDEAIPGLVVLARQSLLEARNSAKRIVRLNNLKEVALMMLNYENMHGSFPPAVLADQGKPMWSWRVAALPFFGENGLFEEFHRSEPWDSPYNLELAKRKMPRVFQAEGVEPGKTCVMVFTGKGAAFDGGKKVKMADIRSGASHTILCVEAGKDKAVFWTKPEDIPFDPANPLAALGQVSPDGLLAVFFDGHAEIIKPTVTMERLKAMITPAGGEPVKPEVER
ncbi:MAG: DUF1559 domain-containing protein [Thermoguttaceae bacterium]